MAYVTHEDISRLGAFQEQSVIVVKAPEETKLEVPAPTEVNYREFTGDPVLSVLSVDSGCDRTVAGKHPDSPEEWEGAHRGADLRRRLRREEGLLCYAGGKPHQDVHVRHR